MFADIDADIYFLVDGDDTYDASAAPGMLSLLIDRQMDMVSAARFGTGQDAYRPGHRLGNIVLSELVTRTFGDGISDLLSGYRVFSRRFVRNPFRPCPSGSKPRRNSPCTPLPCTCRSWRYARIIAAVRPGRAPS